MRAGVERSLELVRVARVSSGMTQRELAERVGLRQSNVAAIETGGRAVSQSMIERLLDAAGYRPSLPLREHAAELKALGEELGVVDIRVFGSVARGDDDGDSDVDLLVTLVPSRVPFRLGVFQSEAERLLGFDVDVVVDNRERSGLDEVRATAVPL